MIKITFGPGYEQAYQDLVQDNQELRAIIGSLVTLFGNNPNDTRLNNHALTKRLFSKYAFSITSSIRIKYEWANKTTVRFLDIGPHEKVYPKPKVSVRKSKKIVSLP